MSDLAIHVYNTGNIRELRLDQPRLGSHGRRAAAAGITAAYTSNDAVNAPMLAVNTWLGYQPTATERSFTKIF